MVELKPIECVVTVRRLEMEGGPETAEARASDLYAKLVEVTKQYTELAMEIGVVPLDMPFHTRVLAHAKRVRSWLPKNVDAANRAARVAGFAAGAPLETVVRDLYQREQRAMEGKEKADARLRSARAKIRDLVQSNEDLMVAVLSERALNAHADRGQLPIRITKVEEPPSYPAGPECSIQDAAAPRVPVGADPYWMVWECKVAAPRSAVKLARGSDLPMRRAVREAFRMVTGLEDSVCFSGWNGSLTEGQRIVAYPDRQRHEEQKRKLAQEEAARDADLAKRIRAAGEQMLAEEAKANSYEESQPGSNYRDVGDGKLAHVDELLAAKDAEIARLKDAWSASGLQALENGQAARIAEQKLAQAKEEAARLTSELEAVKRKPVDPRTRRLPFPLFGRVTDMDRPGDTVNWEGAPCLSVGQSLWIMHAGVPAEATVDKIVVHDPEIGDRRVSFTVSHRGGWSKGGELVYGDIDAKTGKLTLRTGALCARTKEELRDLVFGKGGAS